MSDRQFKKKTVFKIYLETSKNSFVFNLKKEKKKNDFLWLLQICF